MTEPTKLKIKIHELSLEKRLGLLHIHNQIKEIVDQIHETEDVTLGNVRDLKKMVCYLHDTFDFKPKTFVDKDGTARGAYWDKYVLGEDSLAYKEEK